MYPPGHIFRLLHLEDSLLDAELIHHKLESDGMVCEITHVDSRDKFEEALAGATFDLILCDYNLPGYDGFTAMKLARQMQPDAPVIFLSGSVGEEEAVQCLQQGATDYLLKQRLERFVPAVKRALQEAAEQRKRRQTEDELRESSAMLRLAGRTARLGGWAVVFPAGRVVWSEEICNIHEVPPGSTPTMDEAFRFITPEWRPKLARAMEACREQGMPFDLEMELITAKGSRIWVRSIGHSEVGKDGKVRRIHGALQDITKRKQDELELSRINRALKMLSSCNEAQIRVGTEQELLAAICRIAVEIGGYRMAWVGCVQSGEAMMIKPAACAGEDVSFLPENGLDCTGDDLAVRALRTSRTTVCKDIASEPDLSPWLKAARDRGHRGVICLPLQADNRSLGVLCLHSTEVHSRGTDEISLLKELSDDVAFGLSNIRGRLERQHAQEVVLKIARAVSTCKGTEFFDILNQNLVEALDAEGGIIGRLDKSDRAAVTTLSFTMNQMLVENISYPLLGTPCEGLSHGYCLTVDREIQRHFPDDKWLKEHGVEAYAGIPLIDGEGEVVGIMAVFYSKPMANPILVDSTLKIFAARAVDEMQRRESDTRIREQASLLDKAQDAILVCGLNKGISYWNKSAERLYGWTEDEVLGTPAATLLEHEPRAYEQAYSQVLATGEWTGELNQTGKDGRKLVCESRWTLVRDESGQPNSVLAINTDITEKKKLEMQFLRAQRMESIGTLAGGIAHDLNNVLAPITMAIDLLKMTVADKAGKEILDTIAESAKRGADMVGQVLSFARGMEGRRLEVQVRHLISEIEKIVRDTFPKNIQMRTAAAGDLWTLTGDPTQLHQVLLNLCVNSRDAMPGGGQITISTENVHLDAQYAAMNIEAKAGAYLLLLVEDNGSGMTREVMDHIFDPFFTTKELGKGTGLGLSTSLAIVKGHGGFIRVYSEPGNGTRFEIYLPALQETQEQELVVGASPELPRGCGELVLVVDDEPSIRQITSQTLEAFGYRVVVASDGAEAVSIYARQMSEIAVVLLDMMMPVMDGSSTIQVLMKMNPSIRIIAASGISSNGGVARASGAGVKHFVPKPYTAGTLLKVLKQTLTA